MHIFILEIQEQIISTYSYKNINFQGKKNYE